MTAATEQIRWRGDVSGSGITLRRASIKIHEVPIESYPLAISIARWANQSLHSQPTTSVGISLILLLEAILSEPGG
jgi:hypothetical protein